MKKLVLSLFLDFLAALLFSVQLESKESLALKINEPIAVDGHLVEPGWAKAQELIDFIQFSPERGKPASTKTVVKILYDKKFFYVGFFMF
jgi:hypothetical protein